jgi:hypothetical protein
MRARFGAQSRGIASTDPPLALPSRDKIKRGRISPELLDLVSDPIAVAPVTAAIAAIATPDWFSDPS